MLLYECASLSMRLPLDRSNRMDDVLGMYFQHVG